jgi:PAS domain S-box-containing protein
VNPAYAALVGRSVDEVARQPVLEMYPPSDHAIVLGAIAHANRHGAAHFECRMGRRDGTTEPVEGDLRVLRDANGTPRYRIATLRSTRRRLDTERQLATAIERMRALTQRLETVQEAERARVATELHEGLMQSLAGLNLGLETLKQRVAGLPSGDALAGRFVELQAAVRDMTQTTRATLERFHPTGLRHLGLWPTIEHALGRWSAKHGVAVDTDLQVRPALPDDTALIALRVLEEALGNVVRHAYAKRVRVTSRDEGRFVEIGVSDDGIGIAPGEREKPNALGLLGASERLRGIGGELEVERLRPRGTRVTLRVPKSRGAKQTRG